jgi:hypothetical protein
MSDQHDFDLSKNELGDPNWDNGNPQEVNGNAALPAPSMHIDTAPAAPDSPDLPGETADAFYARLIPLCVKHAQLRDASLADSDAAARQYLVLAFSITRSKFFNAVDFARRHKWPWHPAYEANPCLLVIRCIDPSRNRQVANNQALAVRYAVQQCEIAGKPYHACFDGMSINEALRLAREANKPEKTDPPQPKYAVIDQVPIELVSKKSALILVHFRDGRGIYVDTVESNDNDASESEFISDDGVSEGHPDAA